MKIIARAMALCAVASGVGMAQAPRNVTDSGLVTRQAAVTDTTTASRARLARQAQAQAPGARLAPDISAVADMIADASPKGSTQEGGCRLCIREVEVAIQAPIDPYFRGDLFLGFSDAEGVAVEQAYLTATALPWQLEGRAGRFLMPFSKQNTTHRHDLHTIDYPLAIQSFLGEEGLKGTGLYAARAFSPFGFFQEVIVTAVDRIGEAPEGLEPDEPINRDIEGLGYSARLRNYWDIGESSNLEISGSAMTGGLEQPLTTGTPNAVGARQTHVGGDITFRWRPLQQGNYRSFILQTEFIRQLNQRVDLPTYAGPMQDFDGMYAFTRYQLTRRGFVGARFDYVEDPFAAGATMRAASGYLQWFPSEFSKLVAGYERRMPSGQDATDRILVQATFSVGPHKPHPF